MNIAITGANSSVGLSLLRHLAGEGDIQAIACVRSERAAAALPASAAVSPRVIAYDDRERLTSVLTGAACVVHLAGILMESRGSTYQTANVDATRAVVEACRLGAVRHLVLVSALGADESSPNRYFSSKGRAERLVAESGLDATIIRTPILLGPGTAGARALVRTASRPSARVLGGGRHTIRPLDVDDLSQAILHCCRARTAGVAVHELVGPEPTAYRDVIARTGRLLGRRVSVRSMPVWLARLGAAAAGWTGRGGMTPTVIDVITSDEIVRENAARDLGVSLTPLSRTLENLLQHGAATHDQ
jgi:uncharacterized protein YbjT (DUF2867 family)